MSRKLPMILYHNCYSPPSRMALLAIRNLGLDIEVKNIDIYKGEQNTPDYLKINPLHQVPVLVHEDFVLTESRAIMMYLASLIESPMYPKNDLKKRALVDSRLFFDATNSFVAVKDFAVRSDCLFLRSRNNYCLNFRDQSSDRESRKFHQLHVKALKCCSVTWMRCWPIPNGSQVNN